MKPIVEIFSMLITLLRSLIARRFIPKWVRMILAVTVGILLALQVMCGGFAPRHNDYNQFDSVQTTVERHSEDLPRLKGSNTGIDYDPWAGGQHP